MVLIISLLRFLTSSDIILGLHKKRAAVTRLSKKFPVIYSKLRKTAVFTILKAQPPDKASVSLSALSGQAHHNC